MIEQRKVIRAYTKDEPEVYWFLPSGFDGKMIQVFEDAYYNLEVSIVSEEEANKIMEVYSNESINPRS